MKKSDDCWIMCGGPSATKKIAVPVNDTIIAVNKDVWRYPNSDYMITMDNRFTIWEVTSGKHLPAKPVKIFVVNMSEPHMKHKFSFSDTRWGISYDLSAYDMIIKSYSKTGLGKTFNNFCNGGNSGYCAIQLAIILGFKNIHLVGMDLCRVERSTHHHGGYPKSHDDFDRRCDEFFDVMHIMILNNLCYFKDVMLINHSPISKLRKLIGYEPIN